MEIPFKVPLNDLVSIFRILKQKQTEAHFYSEYARDANELIDELVSWGILIPIPEDKRYILQDQKGNRYRFEYRDDQQPYAVFEAMGK